MSERDERIEKYLDDQPEHLSLPEDLNADEQEQWAFELQLQHKLDASLNRQFGIGPVDSKTHRKQIEAMLLDADGTPAGRWKSRASKWVLAASIVLLASLGYWQFGGMRDETIQFKRVPLVELYQDTIERGFKPYYVCDDPPRFAAEFEKRQGVPLRLSEMPAQHEMVGISYLGGISREATVMLGLAAESPVLVFVDRLSNDDEKLKQQVGPNGDLYVWRGEKEGLVFYEVSQFDQPQLVQYFERAVDSTK